MCFLFILCVFNKTQSDYHLTQYLRSKNVAQIKTTFSYNWFALGCFLPNEHLQLLSATTASAG